MLRFLIVMFFFNNKVGTVVQNGTCPEVAPKEIDFKELDGKWYLAAVATDRKIDGDCAMIVFSHKNNNTTDISISWIVNNTVSFYNGSVSLTVDPKNSGDMLLVTYTDKKTETYSLIDVNYEHYAVFVACSNNLSGNSSTYEMLKLTRTPHLKDTDAAKLDQAVASYNGVQETQFNNFNNTEDSCKINRGNTPSPASLIMTSTAAIALFRRLY